MIVPGLPNIGTVDFVREDIIPPPGFPPDQRGMMTSSDGANFGKAMPARVCAVIDGLEMAFAGRELPIPNKTASGPVIP